MAFIAPKHEGVKVMHYWGCTAFIAPCMTLVCFTHYLRLRFSMCHTFVLVVRVTTCIVHIPVHTCTYVCSSITCKCHQLTVSISLYTFYLLRYIMWIYKYTCTCTVGYITTCKSLQDFHVHTEGCRPEAV